MEKILLYKLKLDTLSIECIAVDRFDAQDYFIDEPPRKKDWQPQRMTRLGEHQTFTSLDAAVAAARQLAAVRMTEVIRGIEHTVSLFPCEDKKLKRVLSILSGQVNKLLDLDSQLNQFS